MTTPDAADILRTRTVMLTKDEIADAKAKNITLQEYGRQKLGIADIDRELGEQLRSIAPALAARPLPKPVAKTPSADESDTEMVILPDPVGFHMLVALPTMAERTKGGIIIMPETNERERAAAVVGTVLAMGAECYKDAKRFPAGKPWCKTGDKVLFSRYSGMRFKTKDVESGEMVEYRMLSDDQIVGTVPDGAEVGAL